ncbi:hypothetical protein DFQ26_008183 [Actinomortierella ambigua]|nr:hypothetical protein DFQ26_008183 [Actinomortierella ambigua]
MWGNLLPILKHLSDQLDDQPSTTAHGRPEIQVNIYAHPSAREDSSSSSSSWSSTLEKFMPIPILIWIQGSALLARGGSGSGLGHHGREGGGPTLALPSFTFKTTTLMLARTVLIKRM